MIPVLQLSREEDRKRIDALLNGLRLDPLQLALVTGERAKQAADVQTILADVAQRGDEAVADIARRFDDPAFTANQIRVTPEQMREGARRVDTDQLEAIQHAIKQLREYQTHMMPKPKPPLLREGVELGM